MSIIYSLASQAATGVTSGGTTSSDGRYVLSWAAGTLALFDQQTGTAQTITSQYFGNADDGGLVTISLSRDGRFVTYIDYDGANDVIHLWDRESGTTTTVYAGPKPIFSADVSADDNYIYLTALSQTVGSYDLKRVNIQSGATDNLYTGTLPVEYATDRYAILHNDDDSVSRLDTQTGAIVQVAPPGATVGTISFSNDGRFAVFALDSQIYLTNLTTGSRTLISKNSSGAAGNGASNGPIISADGIHIAFTTAASDISAGASSSHLHVVVLDVTTGVMAFVADVGASGQATAISEDGSVVTLTTDLQLVPADTDTQFDVYTAHIAAPKITIDTISGDGYVNSLEAGFPVTVKGTSDAIGKMVHITSPNGTTTTVTVKADGTWTAQFVDVSGVAEGTRNFTADVVDDSTLHGTAVKSADFDYTPPALVLNAVAGDNVVARRELSAITIDGSSDAYGQQVSLSIDHHFIGKALVSATGEWSFVYDGTNLSDGQHEIEFSVDDAAGNVNDRSIFFDKVTPHNVAPTFFADGGYVVTPIGSFGALGTALAIGADGKIVVGGWGADGTFRERYSHAP